MYFNFIYEINVFNTYLIFAWHDKHHAVQKLNMCTSRSSQILNYVKTKINFSYEVKILFCAEIAIKHQPTCSLTGCNSHTEYGSTFTFSPYVK